MMQILGHALKNWLLIIIMHGWPCLSNQAMYGALPICCLGNWSWKLVGIGFTTLLFSFACPYPELKPIVGKSTIGSVTNVN